MNKLAKVFIIFCILMAVTPMQISLAQTNIGPGVDLIILIDQSNSMFGLGATEEREAIAGTDRNGRRVDTAQYLIDYMAFDNLHVNQNRTNRVLVIAFGSYGREKVIVPLTELNSSQDAQKAKELVAPLKSPSESLNGTDFISVFEKISDQFSSTVESPNLKSRLRRRLVVVITDGGPDIRGTRFDDQKTYFKHLGEIYQEKLGEQYPVYVIGIDKNEPPLYWNDVVDLWKTNVTGEDNAVRVTDPDEINKQVVKMFCPFLNPQGTGDECRLQDIGDHLVLPYARYVSFSFFKYDPSAKIELYRPTLTGETGGEKVQIEPTQDSDVVEYNETESDEFFGLENPRPGCWRSEREGAGKVDVLLQIVFNDMLMTQPSIAHPSVSPLDFEFSLKDTKGNPIDELGDFPINLDAKLTAPDGSSQAVTMIKAQPGLYTSQQPVLTPITGAYELSLAGTTTIPTLDNCLSSSGRYTIFSQTFQIPVYRPDVTVTQPNKPYLPHAPLEGLTVQFIDKNGEPINIDDRLEPDMAITSPKGDEKPLENVTVLSDSLHIESPITLPDSGIYTVAVSLETNGDKVYEGMATIETGDAVEVIWPAKDYPAFAPLRFVEIELQDENGQPVSANPKYPLQIEASMTWPNGYSDTVRLDPTDDEGRYRVSASWPLTKVADHELEIKGYASLSPGSPDKCVFGAHRTINVSSNLPYYKVIQPNEQQSEQTYSLHHWFLPPLPFDFTLKPQPIEVKLRYSNRLAQAKDFFRGDLNDLFYIKIVDSDGEILVENHSLSCNGESTFSTEIHQLEESGDFKVTISPDGELRGGTNVQGVWSSVEVPFKRRDPVTYFVAWAIIGVVALGAMAYFGGGWVLNRFFLPKAKGKLVAVLGAINARSSLWDFDITRQRKHHFTIGGQEIDARLQLSKIEVRRAMPQTRRKESEEGIKITAYNEEGVTVAEGAVYPSRKLSVRQRTIDDKRYKFEYEA